MIVFDYNNPFKSFILLWSMFVLRFFDRGKRPKDEKGIEISGHSLDLAGRLDDKFQNEDYAHVENVYHFLVDGGVVSIEHCHSENRGDYANIELRGGACSVIEGLAERTSLSYAPNEVDCLE
jgi:hypothetical protein